MELARLENSCSDGDHVFADERSWDSTRAIFREDVTDEAPACASA